MMATYGGHKSMREELLEVERDLREKKEKRRQNADDDINVLKKQKSDMRAQRIHLYDKISHDYSRKAIPALILWGSLIISVFVMIMFHGNNHGDLLVLIIVFMSLLAILGIGMIVRLCLVRKKFNKWMMKSKEEIDEFLYPDAEIRQIRREYGFS